MRKATLENLGTIVREKRGGKGLREAAAEIGASAPTLSRIESGKMPDLQTFIKLCRWLEIDPATIMGISPRPRDADESLSAAAHLRAKREVAPETAGASPTRLSTLSGVFKKSWSERRMERGFKSRCEEMARSFRAA